MFDALSSDEFFFAGEKTIKRSALIIAFALASICEAQTLYRVVPAPSGFLPTGINDSARMSGNYQNSAAFADGASLTVIRTVKASSSAGINASNQIVLTRLDSGYNRVAIYDPATNRITEPSGPYNSLLSEGKGITEGGSVFADVLLDEGSYHFVGYIKTPVEGWFRMSSTRYSEVRIGGGSGSNGYAAATVRYGTTYRAALLPGSIELGTLGGAASFAGDVNDDQILVGWSNTATGRTHPFICAVNGDRKMVEIGAFGNLDAYAVAINSARSVVGYSQNGPDSTRRAFVVSPDGTVRDLSSWLTPEYAGWTIRTPSGISPSGNISAIATDPSGVQYGVALVPVPPLAVSLDRAQVVGGSTTDVKMTVRLDAKAPAGGASVYLASQDPAVQVPSSVVVPAGKIEASIIVGHSRVETLRRVSLTASYGGKAGVAALDLKPFEVKSLEVTPGSILGGRTASVSVSLNARPKADVALPVASSVPSAVASPGTLVVPAGQSVVVADLPTQAVASTVRTEISATLGASVKTDRLTVLGSLASVTLAKGNWYSSQGKLVEIVLTEPAPADGAVVSFAYEGCSGPSAVAIPAGERTASILAIADEGAAHSAKVTAFYGAGSLGVSASVKPNLVKTISVTPAKFIGGSDTAVYGAVTLLVPVARDTEVALSSDNASVLGVPTTVTVPAGTSSVEFVVSHAAVMKSVRVVLAASRAGTQKTVTVTVYAP